MKESILKSLSISVMYVVFAIFIEVVTFLTLGYGFFPRYSLFDVAIIAILAGVIVLLPYDWLRIAISILFLYTQIVLGIVNNIMYSVSGDLLTVEMIKLAGEGISALDLSFFNWWILVLFISLALVIFVAYLFIYRIATPYVENKRKMALYFVILFCLFQFCGYSWYALSYANLADSSISIESDKVLFQNLKSKTDAFQKFGTFGFYFKNVQICYFINQTLNEETLRDYAQFLLTDNSTPVTDYTGISKGNNVITILLETLEYIAIDPYFTPFLYQLMTEDCYTLTNYVTENKTNVSEGITLFGNYSAAYPATVPEEEIHQALSNTQLPYTLANLVKQQTNGQVRTTYVHDNVGTYYNRDQVFPYAGYDTMITLDNMDTLKEMVQNRPNEEDRYEFTGVFQDFIRDSDMMSTYIDQIAPTTGERFVTSIATITMHGPHEQRQSTQKYYDKIMADDSKRQKMLDYLIECGYTLPDSEKLMDSFYWYKAAAMDVDKALEILFTHLKDTGLDKNTTVLLYSDHNCYYESLSWHFRNLDRSESYVTDLYIQPCMIYDQKLCAKANQSDTYTTGYQDDRFVCTYNNLPTILDLLGLSYNPNIYMGCSIFDENIVNQVFNTLKVTNSYMNDKIYMTQDQVEYIAEDVSLEQLNTFKSNRYIIYQKQLVVDAIYSNPRIFEIYQELQNS